MRQTSILRNTVMLTLTNLSLRSVSLLFQVYLSRTIGAAGMGKMQLVLTVGGFAMTLGTSGVRVAAMNLTARERGLDHPAGVKKAITSCLLYGLFASLLAGTLLYFLAPTLANTFVGDGSVLPAIWLMALSLPLNCACAVLSGCYTALGKIRRMVWTDILERVTSIFFTVLLLQYWADGRMSRICCAVIGGSELATGISFLILFIALFRELRCIRGAEQVKMRGRLIRLCIPLALSDYLRSGLSTLEQFLIPRGLSKNPATVDSSMADYGTVSGMVFPVLMFPAALFYSLSDLLVPELSRCRAKGRMLRIRGICTRSLRVGFVFSAMVSGLLFLLAPALGQSLYHSRSAGQYLRVFAPMILMLYPDALTDGMLKGLGEQVASVRYNTITAACDVVLLFLLLPPLGMGGFVLTFLLTHGLNFFLSLRRLKMVAGLSLPWHHAIKTILVGALSAFFALALCPPVAKFLSMFLSAGVYLALYFLLCREFRVFHPAELLPYLRKKEPPASKEQRAKITA
ncbi:MAG: oligosaccharide flippase family protein [Oscillospiraceae bacterium]|nr:oligosaccharide flippase family protein [Oscillospiraceae bacterium]